jgi:hypothetical protein
VFVSQPNATALASLAETFEGVDACATWTTLWCNDCTATAWELIVVPQVSRSFKPAETCVCIALFFDLKNPVKRRVT